MAKRIVAYRLGLASLDELDATQYPASLRAPTLLFEGTRDTTIPIGPGTAFARAHPDIVTYVLVRGAEHTQSWNVNPIAYDARLTAFLTRVLPKTAH